MVFLGLKLQENRKKTGRKPEENQKKTKRKPKENQRKPKKTRRKENHRPSSLATEINQSKRRAFPAFSAPFPALSGVLCRIRPFGAYTNLDEKCGFHYTASSSRFFY